MDAPLGRAVGNALEVIECLEVLKGSGPADLVEVVGGAGRADAGPWRRRRRSRRRRTRRCATRIASGAGLERFRRIIEQQGGDPRVVDDDGRLPPRPSATWSAAPRAGFRRPASMPSWSAARRWRSAPGAIASRIRSIPRRHHGRSRKPGDELAAGDPVLELHYRDRAPARAAHRRWPRGAIEIGDQRPAAPTALVGEVR